ncbi:MAG: 23S rRNA (uracil(1939)-C(5))-methyltransferase RlmD [Planctomycetes bacterium]|nr:23S rRNA (uracil(1939)-C(5))-methyltransferase RlmD [Planctomycetota bacterium]
MPRPAARRTEEPLPQCRHFGICGGCSLLDQPIAWQLQDKVDAAQRLLAPFLDGVPIEHAMPPRTPQHFRTRLLYPVRANAKGHATVGLYEFHTNELVRIEECRTQDRWLTAFGLAAERVLRDARAQPFDPKRRTGTVMAIWARLASGTGEVAAGVVTRPGTFAEGAAIADGLQHAAASLDVGGRPRQLVGVVHSISERDDEFLLGQRHNPLRGRDHVIDRRDGLQFRVSAGSFYQIHAGAYALLYAPAMAMCGDVRGQRVVDGYGGIGAFGLRLAAAGAAQVLVVEDNAAACRDAEHNAKVNELPNVSVQRTAFAGATLPEGVDLCVVDPPRSGLQPAGVAVVLRAAPRRVLHVACSVEALARDLGELTAGGYRVTAVRVCDLFPHTEHVEVLTMLERK